MQTSVGLQYSNTNNVGGFFPATSTEAVFLKLLLSPEIDSKESIPPAYVAWRAGTRTLFLLGFWPP